MEVGDIEGDLQMHSTWSDGAINKEILKKPLWSKRSLITNYSRIRRGGSLCLEDNGSAAQKSTNKIFEKWCRKVPGKVDDGTRLSDKVLERLDVVVAALHLFEARQRTID